MNTNKSLRTIKLVLPALLLSVVLISFIDNKVVHKQSSKLDNNYIYQFTGDANDINSVQSKANWSYAGPSASLCNDEDDPMACTVAVDAAHHTGTTLAGAVASDLSITADDDIESGTFRVVTVDGDNDYSGTVSNQPVE